MSQTSTHSAFSNSENITQLSILFLRDLVQATLGVAVEDIPAEDREQTLKQVLDLFNEYIYDYIEENYSKNDLIKFKTIQSGQNIQLLDREPQLMSIYDKAFQSYQEFILNN